MNRFKFTFFSLTLAGAVTLAACMPETETPTPSPTSMPVIQEGMVDEQVQEANIVETAQTAGTFTTLLAAAEAAGLVETLSTQELTVFAPTDEAFDKLPAGTVEALLEDTDRLAAILTYHVVPGTIPASEVVNISNATTVQGESLTITTEDGEVMVNDAQVLQTDIMASNGVIHVIDSVLMPPTEQ